ncbi:hypothetical protein [Veillonella nakazawae]|uniref:hypothetical protein n=1 Tax=Veillonella nakazawae TaxID=2682456 RepID=UPI003991C44C
MWNYGRWDDVLRIFFDTTSGILHDGLGALIANQFRRDVMACGLGDSISLLAKWMPSNNTSSKQNVLRRLFYNFITSKCTKYRKTLSRLREHLAVVDRKASLTDERY